MMNTIRLGPAADFTNTPVSLTIAGQPFLLDRAADGAYVLFSAVCPHQGSTVGIAEGCFECPRHGWRFRFGSGEPINVARGGLTRYVVERIGDVLFAHLPARPTARLASRQRSAAAGGDVSIRLLAHACLEIGVRGRTLLTDPWLSGPAFLGAWIQYPPLPIDLAALEPAALWISHEHSDHFHKPTLRQLSKDIPVYVPDFANGRLPEELHGLGFPHVVTMPFGVPFEVFPGLTITVFEPQSLWNDAIVLLDCDGFRLLNLNDAGLNRRIASLIGPVDAVACGFSPGASGYPQTWMHLKPEQKTEVMRRAQGGMLEMLRNAMDLYGGRYLIPFASHFALWHPSHRAFMQAMLKNTIDDVVRTFQDTPVEVIDLLPGESWNVSSGQIERRWKNRTRLYERERLLRVVARRYDEAAFLEHHPKMALLQARDVEAYLLRLNDVPEIVFCEDVVVRLRGMSADFSEVILDVSCEIQNGRLAILRESAEAAAMRIDVPANVLGAIIAQNLSWDEAHIGYWCRFWRSPDVYHAGFWRLLQTPYYRPIRQDGAEPIAVTAEMSIADLIELGGVEADRALRRHGLYCAGCHHSTAETLRAGAKAHAIGDESLDRLVQELSRVVASTTNSTRLVGGLREHLR